MKMRRKLSLALLALVTFMATMFFTISTGYTENLFRQYASAARDRSAEQLARLVGYYYQINGNSWVGIQAYVGFFNNMGREGAQPDYLAVYDAQGNVVFQMGYTGGGPPSTDPNEIAKAPIEVSGVQVGTIRIRDRGTEVLYAIERTILRSVMVATLWGMLITAAVAMLVGLWFARRLTKPLQSMLGAIHRITQGNLDTRLKVESTDEFGEVSHAFNEMTDRLERTEQARRHLVADVAHELRMPLAIMQGQLELIQQGIKPADPVGLLSIQDEILRLTRLVNDLHQLTLAEAGKLPLQLLEVDIAGTVKRIVDNFDIEVQDKHIQLTFHSTVPEETTVMADRDRITQVFVNLLGNAVRFTPDDGTIEVTVRPEGSFVLVSVRDTGPGIPADHVAHVFDRFYRADEDRGRQTGGTGLGLAIAKEYVEAHQGRIEVTSQTGVGTTFTVWLPTETK